MLNWNCSITKVLFFVIFINVWLWLKVKWLLVFAQVRSVSGSLLHGVLCGVLWKMLACPSASRVKTVVDHNNVRADIPTSPASLPAPVQPTALAGRLKVTKLFTVLSSSEKNKQNLLIWVFCDANLQIYLVTWNLVFLDIHWPSEFQKRYGALSL